MVRAADEGRAVGNSSWVRLRCGDEIGELPVRPVGGHRDEEIRAVDQRDRREILLHIVGQFLEQRGVDCDMAVVGHYQFVAVRDRPLRGFQGNEPVGARPRLDDHRMTPGAGQLVGE